MYVYLYSTVMALLDLVIMTLLKLKSTSVLTSPFIIPLTMAIYSLEPLLFLKGLSNQGMAVLNILWDSTSSILIALVGFFVFNENLSLINWLGIVMCSLGMILVNI